KASAGLEPDDFTVVGAHDPVLASEGAVLLSRAIEREKDSRAILRMQARAPHFVRGMSARIDGITQETEMIGGPDRFARREVDIPGGEPGFLDGDTESRVAVDRQWRVVRDKC